MCSYLSSFAIVVCPTNFIGSDIALRVWHLAFAVALEQSRRAVAAPMRTIRVMRAGAEAAGEELSLAFISVRELSVIVVVVILVRVAPDEIGNLVGKLSVIVVVVVLVRVAPGELGNLVGNAAGDSSTAGSIIGS